MQARPGHNQSITKQRPSILRWYILRGARLGDGDLHACQNGRSNTPLLRIALSLFASNIVTDDTNSMLAQFDESKSPS